MPDRIDGLLKRMKDAEDKLKEIILEIEISKEEEPDFEYKYGATIRSIAEDVFKKLQPKPKVATTTRRRTAAPKKSVVSSRTTAKKEEEKNE